MQEIYQPARVPSLQKLMELLQWFMIKLLLNQQVTLLLLIQVPQLQQAILQLQPQPQIQVALHQP